MNWTSCKKSGHGETTNKHAFFCLFHSNSLNFMRVERHLTGKVSNFLCYNWVLFWCTIDFLVSYTVDESISEFYFDVELIF